VINAINTQSQDCFGMPSAARVRSAWTRALPMTTGTAVLANGTGVCVQGTGVPAHRAFIDNATLPGTSVWSPPT
jgi:hypothetical protein